MPSNLRLRLDLQPTQSLYPHSTSLPSPTPKQKMSLSQTYRVASTARGKLGLEAARSDHNLRLLVGHANLLDSLMVELASAERDQEAWFNSTIRNSNRPEAAKHIQWFDSIAEEQVREDIYEDDSSDSDADSDDEDTVPDLPRRRSVSPPPPAPLDFDYEDASDDEYLDLDSDSDELALQRVPSHTPPELMHDSDSEDETSTPPSPSQPTMVYQQRGPVGSSPAMMMMTPARKTHQSRLDPTPRIVVEEMLTASSGSMIAAY